MLDAAQKRAGGIPGSQDKAGGSIGGRSPETKERAENPEPDYAEAEPLVTSGPGRFLEPGPRLTGQSQGDRDQSQQAQGQES